MERKDFLEVVNTTMSDNDGYHYQALKGEQKISMLNEQKKIITVMKNKLLTDIAIYLNNAKSKYEAYYLMEENLQLLIDTTLEEVNKFAELGNQENMSKKNQGA